MSPEPTRQPDREEPDPAIGKNEVEVERHTGHPRRAPEITLKR